MQLRPLLLTLSLLLICTPIPTFAKDPMLKEKIGQMLLIGFKGTSLKPQDPIVKAILNDQIGGVILFDYDFPSQTYDHNIKNPAQLKNLTQQLQAYTKQAATIHHHSYQPLFVGIDYEGGKVNRLKETYGFPKTLSAQAVGKLSYTEAMRYAESMAKTLQEEGINFNFAPVIDLNINPESPIIGKLERSFSDNENKVSAYASIFSKAYQNSGVLCSYKHFPGHGSANGDTHKGFVDVTSTWKEIELTPYQTLFSDPSQCPAVMVAHVVHYGLDSKGYPASISYPIIHDLLRGKLNFNGVVVSDDMQMKAITDHYGLHEAVRLAINAGVDILVFGNQLAATEDPAKIIDMIYEDVKTGKIRESRIEESYQRIMKLKQHLTH